MKKLVFTALTVVAFSSVSMANINKTEKTLNGSTFELSVIINDEFAIESYEIVKPCYDKAMAAVDCSGSNDAQYNHDLYQWVLDHC